MAYPHAGLELNTSGVDGADRFYRREVRGPHRPRGVRLAEQVPAASRVHLFSAVKNGTVKSRGDWLSGSACPSAALLIRPELLSRVNERICASGPSRRLPKGCGSPSQ